MNQTVLTLAPGGPELNQALGWEPQAVVVDNFTPSYLTLPDAGRTLPPWVYGAVVALPPGLRRAVASLSSGVAVAGPPTPIVQATLTWTDAALPPGAGHLLQQSQYNRVNPTSFVITAAAALSNTVQVTDVSPFVAGDMLYLHQRSGASSASGAIISEIDPDTNTITVTTALGVAVSPGDTVSVLPAVFVRVNAGSGAQPVTLATATAAPWQAASSGVAIHLTTQVDPLKDTIIAGVAAKAIRLHGWSLHSDAGPFSVYLRTTTLGKFAETRFLSPGGVTSHSWHDFHGRPMPVGEAVTISSDAAAFVSGTLDYALDPA